MTTDSKIPGYTKSVRYTFTIRSNPIDRYGQEYEISSHGNNATIEETRKNGQEDTHFYAYLIKNEEGDWEFESEDYSRDQARTYGHDFDKIKEHIEFYGVPK